MRKPFVIAAMLLCSSLAIAQEADELGGSNAEFSVIARAEYLYGDPLGNSSLYATFDGSISDNLTYSFGTHLLSSTPGALYANSFRADDVDWLDWATLTWAVGDFELTFGKEDILLGTNEMAESDWDIHFPFASSIWHNLYTYEWGLRGTWYPVEGLTLDGRISASPYSAYPFTGGLLTYGLKAAYEQTESWGVMAAYDVIGTDAGEYTGLLTAGANLFLGDANICVDFQNKVGDPMFVLVDGISTSLQCAYTFSEQLTAIAHTGYEKMDANFGGLEDINAGLAVHYFPIEGLRVHALGSYRWGDIAPGPTFSIGVTYNFSLYL